LQYDRGKIKKKQLVSRHEKARALSRFTFDV
jgi:hypothetical protein